MKHLVFLLCAGLLGLWGCQSGSEIIGLDNSSSNQLNVLLIDTLTVNSATIITDSIQTSGSGVLLVGRTVNRQSGNVLARAFFQPNINGAFALNGDANRIKYDSLVLQLRYRRANFYNAAYGDTTQLQNISFVPFKSLPDDATIYYNSDQVPLADTPLASVQYRPRPLSDTTINLRLPNTLGQKLFDLIRTGTLADNDALREILPGFALLPGITDNGAIVTFLTTSRIALFYHDSDFDINKYQFLINIRAGNTQFNYIENDRTGTPLASLIVPRQDVVDSRLSNEETYVQFGAGLRTVYSVPGLSNLKNIPGFANINRAELIIKPLRFSASNNTPLPTSLILQPVNANNGVNGTLVSYSGTQVASNLLTDYSLVVPTFQYSFTLTNFVSNIAKGTSPNQGLLLAPASGTDLGLAFNRVALGSQRNPNKDVRLQFRVYYTTNR